MRCEVNMDSSVKVPYCSTYVIVASAFRSESRPFFELGSAAETATPQVVLPASLFLKLKAAGTGNSPWKRLIADRRVVKRMMRCLIS